MFRLYYNTSILPGKVKRTSKGVTKSSKWKKAFVEVSKDQTIKLFEGILERDIMAIKKYNPYTSMRNMTTLVG